MSREYPFPRTASEPAALNDLAASEINANSAASTAYSEALLDGGALTPMLSGTPSSPNLSRTASFSNRSGFAEDWEAFPPLEKLTVFDFLDNIALPQRIEKWQQQIAAQTEKVRRQREKLRATGKGAKDRAMAEWKKRAPTSEEQMEKYRYRVGQLTKRLGEAGTVTVREKTSFIAGVLNVFISGYMIGAMPEYFYVWFTAQLCYFMPIRYYTYQRRGYHYFLADLCYFVNFLLMLTIWCAPTSKRLFISTYCLAYGNNAVAIAMWRNSLVFHSLDKVTSLFIHIMPPVTLHCLVHLTSEEFLADRFPAIHSIKYSPKGSSEHYNLWAMMVWATVPYAVWQLSYHFLITVRRREKIRAGRPTSFTWLRKSYAKTWIGRFVLGLPEYLQEPAFMMIQYLYALLTMLPCPLWFWFRWPSSLFLFSVFTWSIYNGATFYIDIFSGTKFQKELEALKKDVAKWQASPAGMPMSPGLAADDFKKNEGIEMIPRLDGQATSVTGSDIGAEDVAIERKKDN